ncbi:MAG: chloride channel protein [Anaerolineae bacterium]|nr:chloride channel protein [Anaerolineae bacterium]
MKQDTLSYSPLPRFSRWLGGLLDRLQLSEEIVMLATSLLVGVGTGLGAVVFNRLIQWVTKASFEWIPQTFPWLGSWYIVIVPTLGGLLAGPLICFFAREAKGHGVPEVMEAIALQGGRIRPIVVVVKAVASSLTIGTGGSVGREGPIVQIGAALGSTLGQGLRLSEDRVRSLVACGVAGGIAATFNAPIAGVIFALEVILGELSVGHVGTVVLSAVTANTVARVILGSEYAFPVPKPYAIHSLWEYGVYAVLGVLAALVAALYVRTLYGAEDAFEKQKLIPEWLQPAVGGMLLGLMVLAYPLVFPMLHFDVVPQVFGGGYAPIAAALSNQVILLAALALIFLKMAATNLTLGSGGSGGIFAPSLFMGAMLGVVVGTVAGQLFPGMVAPPGAYSLVGMAAVFAGAAHAPVTALIILFEITGDYQIILPLMLTVVITTLLSRKLLGGESIYTLKLTRRGIRLQRGRDIDIMESVTVGEAMQQHPETVTMDMTIVELSEVFSRVRHHGFVVVNHDGTLWGVVTIEDLEQAVGRDIPRRATVAEIGTPLNELLVAYPDEPVGVALGRLATRGLGRLPVVSRDDATHLVGLIRRQDIIRAYNIALARRAELQHRTRRMQLRNIDGTEFVELTLTEGSCAVGMALHEFAATIPSESTLVSIRRAGRVLIPHGDTIFQVGDRITAFVRSRDRQTLLNCLHGDGENRT